MHLLGAQWLLLLIPWLALAIWLWRHQRRIVVVSNPMHWPRTPDALRTDTARHSMPPLWITLVLGALLAAIFALAEPVRYVKRAHLTILIDPHVSMLAKANAKPVYEQIAGRVSRALTEAGDVEVGLVVAGSPTSLRSLGELHSIRWTAKPTTSLIEQRANEEVALGNGVIVMSAQALQLPAEALCYGPTTLPIDRAIIQFAASTEPRAQVMVSVHHPQRAGEIAYEILTSTGQKVPGFVTPEENAQDSTAFTDLPDDAGAWAEVHLTGRDDFDANDRAFLVRKGHWPRIELSGELPAAVERFAAVYAQRRRADENSPTILLTTRMPSTGLAIVFSATKGLQQEQSVSVQLPWKTILGLEPLPIRSIATEMPAEYEAIARQGDQPILAVTRSTPRRVWVGFDIESFSATPQFVAWMNALFDFVIESDTPRWESVSPASATPDWVRLAGEATADASPGVYRTPSGELHAVRPEPVRWATTAELGGRDPQTLINSVRTATPLRLGRYLCWLALFLGLVAAVLMAATGRLDGKGDAT